MELVTAYRGIDLSAIESGHVYCVTLHDGFVYIGTAALPRPEHGCLPFNDVLHIGKLCIQYVGSRLFYDNWIRSCVPIEVIC
jgi:hypothetical protein